VRGTPIAVGLVLAVAVSFTGAREVRSEDSLAYPFASKARAPEGGVFRLTFSPRAGETYEEKVVHSGKTTVPETDGVRETAIAASMTAVHRCKEVRPDGTCVMPSSVESLQGDDADDPEQVAEMLKVVVTWEADRFGAIQRGTADGGTAAARSEVEGKLFAPGARAFLVFPAAGVRIGNALDYVKMFDAADVRRALLGTTTPFEPEAKSEAVCVRRTTLSGESVAEFAVNAVLFAAIDLSDGQVRLESAARYTGSVVVSTKTGMPVGRTEMRLEGRVGVSRDGVRTTVTRDVHMTREFKRRAAG
jgi:hypothetical protein